MCRMQCLLAFFALAINLCSSWDIAVTTKDQIEFYSNQSKKSFEASEFRDLTALAYDAVHNMLLFVDKQNDNASIFSLNLLTMKYLPLVGRRSNENIQGLAFDPITNRMFWTDSTNRSIYWMSLLPRSKDNIYGNVLLKMDDEMPRAIAVDSCRGYIYWTNTNVKKATIERARFDGSERTVIIDKDIFMPVSIAIDQKAKKLYWADDKEGIHYSIESSNLDGGDRRKILTGIEHHPNSITVSGDSIYWVDWGYKKVWRLSKNASPYVEPEEYFEFDKEQSFGIVANYEIADQTAGVAECKKLATLSQNKTLIGDATPILTDMGLFCIHGKKTGISSCQCHPGYSGTRCEIYVCENFCLHGDCSASPRGQPTCKCNSNYAGERCEVDLCLGRCLNGECSVSDGIPSCRCDEGYEGERCEREIRTAPAPAPINCTEKALRTSENVLSVRQTEASKDTIQAESTTDEVVYLEPVSCGQHWDGVRDPALLVLGVMCGLLSVAVAALGTKVLHLRRRPRIKKRIIVNKNVTPLTARPEQCEITIENCCNMNICETPCFEPRNNIRPTLRDAKPGKEEKRNLIADMETPDDC